MSRSRSKQAMKNTVTTLLYEVVAIICGLILPRLILSAFGSSYNGITSSITQFLSCITLFVTGVSAVTRAALYKPLADKSVQEISAVVNATNSFMYKLTTIFVVSIIAFACVYPFLVQNEFDWMFSSTLVIILSASTVVQYFFGFTYQVLLAADQKYYITVIIRITTLVLNTVIAAILIKAGAGIHLVKLGSAVAFSLNPILIQLYVRRHYKLDKKIPPNNNAIKQRWNAFGQSVAFFVHNNTDIILLTCFSNTKEISVYSVYNNIILNIRSFVLAAVNGFDSAFGDMIAKKEFDLVEKNLRIAEVVVFGLTSVIYTVAGIMLVPFAIIYTSGINDVSYSRPIFSFIITLAGAFSCLRIPYKIIVNAAGHFKQTMVGAFVEAGLNILISIVFVFQFGLIGVAVGTLVATIFRSVQYSWYVAKNIVKRSQWIFFAHVALAGVVAILTVIVSHYCFIFETPNFLMWCIKAILVTLTATAFSLGIHFVFYRYEIKSLFKKVTGIFKKQKKKENK